MPTTCKHRFLLQRTDTNERFIFSVVWRHANEDGFDVGGLVVDIYRLKAATQLIWSDGFNIDFLDGDILFDDENGESAEQAYIALHIADFRAPVLEQPPLTNRTDGRGFGLGTAFVHLIHRTIPSMIAGRVALYGMLSSLDAQDNNWMRRDNFWTRCLARIENTPVIQTDSKGEGRVIGLLRDPYAAGSNAVRWDIVELTENEFYALAKKSDEVSGSTA